MADDHQRALVGPEEVEHPRLGVDVEVVGGLVEQQDVGAGEEDADQLDPPPLPAGQRAERPVEDLVGHAETGGQAADLALGA